jgi:hypothetical protein
VTATLPISLALDFGTTTGWAPRTPEGQIVSGTQSFKPSRCEGGRMRFLRFRPSLPELKLTSSALGAFRCFHGTYAGGDHG